MSYLVGWGSTGCFWAPLGPLFGYQSPLGQVKCILFILVLWSIWRKQYSCRSGWKAVKVGSLISQVRRMMISWVMASMGVWMSIPDNMIERYYEDGCLQPIFPRWRPTADGFWTLNSMAVLLVIRSAGIRESSSLPPSSFFVILFVCVWVGNMGGGV